MHLTNIHLLCVSVYVRKKHVIVIVFPYFFFKYKSIVLGIMLYIHTNIKRTQKVMLMVGSFWILHCKIETEPINPKTKHKYVSPRITRIKTV